jgi:hypothetical protein
MNNVLARPGDVMNQPNCLHEVVISPAVVIGVIVVLTAAVTYYFYLRLCQMLISKPIVNEPESEEDEDRWDDFDIYDEEKAKNE